MSSLCRPPIGWTLRDVTDASFPLACDIGPCGVGTTFYKFPRRLLHNILRLPRYCARVYRSCKIDTALSILNNNTLLVYFKYPKGLNSLKTYSAKGYSYFSSLFCISFLVFVFKQYRWLASTEIVSYFHISVLLKNRILYLPMHFLLNVKGFLMRRGQWYRCV